MGSGVDTLLTPLQEKLLTLCLLACFFGREGDTQLTFLQCFLLFRAHLLMATPSLPIGRELESYQPMSGRFGWLFRTLVYSFLKHVQ